MQLCTRGCKCILKRRQFIQKREMLVQGLAFNLASNPGIVRDGEYPYPEDFAIFVVSAADEILKKMYSGGDKADETEK